MITRLHLIIKCLKCISTRWASQDVRTTGVRTYSAGATLGQVEGSVDKLNSDIGLENTLFFKFKVPPPAKPRLGKRETIGEIKSPLRGGRLLSIELSENVDSVRLNSNVMGGIKILSQARYQIGPIDTKAKGSLWFFRDSDTLIVEISETRQVFDIYGVFSFEDETAGLSGAALMYAAVYCQDGLGYWYVEDDGYTDATAFLSLQQSRSEPLWFGQSFHSQSSA